MMVDINTLISMSEANRDFSRVAKLVDENGAAIILDNNVPRYVIMEFPAADRYADESEVMRISDKLIEKNFEAYKELAK